MHLVGFQKGFFTFYREGHDERCATVAEPDAEEVRNRSLAGDAHRGGSPIDLGGLARGEGQGDVSFRIPGPQYGIPGGAPWVRRPESLFLSLIGR